MLTGEPLPVTKRVGDKLIGATLNTSAALLMRSEHVGSATVLSQIVQSVAQAQRSKAPMQRMADVVAAYFVYGVVGIALLTFFAWGSFGPELANESSLQGRALSVATVSNMKQNLGFAFIYNMLGVPLAAGVLFPFTGWLLSPMIGALAMSLSSVSVISNALRLRITAIKPD